MQSKLSLSIGLAIVLGSSSAAFADTTTINALFMAQAAYSEQNIRDMTAGFEKDNPDIKVNLELVPYEALHDKTVLAQGGRATTSSSTT
jgi:multiple sugar transport system substrate-binding protein